MHHATCRDCKRCSTLIRNIASIYRNKNLNPRRQMRGAVEQDTQAENQRCQCICDNYQRMLIDCVHFACRESNVCCKQRDEDGETKRQRDMFDGNSVEAVSFAGQETKSHDAHHRIENKSGDISSLTLFAENDDAYNTWNSNEEKSKTDVQPGMRVCKPLQRTQPSQIKRRPRQRKHGLTAASSASHRDAGNNKHAATRHLSLLVLQPALPQPRERLPSRCSRGLQLRGRARV